MGYLPGKEAYTDEGDKPLNGTVKESGVVLLKIEASFYIFLEKKYLISKFFSHIPIAICVKESTSFNK